ncbi:hypothetical protein, partial [Posidoniimonas polymericola]|uniref:hypothetical protein n=1 Tax=Posidoniimonas polymericola TaxID=2528002 RepID=UPI0011B6FC59
MSSRQGFFEQQLPHESQPQDGSQQLSEAQHDGSPQQLSEAQHDGSAQHEGSQQLEQLFFL